MHTCPPSPITNADFSRDEEGVRQPVAATILGETETEPGLVAIMHRLQYAPRYVPTRSPLAKIARFYNRLCAPLVSFDPFDRASIKQHNDFAARDSQSIVNFNFANFLFQLEDSLTRFEEHSVVFVRIKINHWFRGRRV